MIKGSTMTGQGRGGVGRGADPASPPKRRSCGGSAKAGQAMTELIVALVSLLVLVAGIIQISTLGLLHTRVMNEARRLAGVKALQDAPPFAGPQYIAERTVGGDGVRYSADDGTTAGDASAFQARIVGYAKPDELEKRRPGNVFTPLYKEDFPQLQFGLVEGRAKASTNLIPIVRTLLYNADEIEVKGQAWLTWTKGIY